MKTRRAKAKIIRTVTEIAIVMLDTSGQIEEIEEVLEELETDNEEVVSIITVLSVHSYP